MIEADTRAERDGKTGRFLAGNSGNGGRKPGSRSKLGEEFIAKFAADVELHGASVIERVRTEKPEVYLKVWADLLPRKTELDVNIDLAALTDVAGALDAFHKLSDMLGTAPQISPQRLRRLATKVIEHDPIG